MRLTRALEQGYLHSNSAIVVGLARGGVPVAAELARQLSLPLDALAVRKIGHPWQPEYAIGAVAPGEGGVYLRSSDGLTERQLRDALARAQTDARSLDGALHRTHSRLDPRGKGVVLVDDGLATGATMVAAVRWARHRGAAHVIVAVPVGATQSIRFLQQEADDVVCPHPMEELGAVGLWYSDFAQVDSAAVARLLDELHEADDGTS